jgi:hypothetical protein
LATFLSEPQKRDIFYNHAAQGALGRADGSRQHGLTHNQWKDGAGA